MVVEEVRKQSSPGAAGARSSTALASPGLIAELQSATGKRFKESMGQASTSHPVEVASVLARDVSLPYFKHFFKTHLDTQGFGV